MLSKLFTRTAIFILLSALFGLICFLYAYFIEPYSIEVKSVNIFTEKFQKANLRLIQISDLHCDKKVRNEERMVEIINSLKPDISLDSSNSLIYSNAYYKE